MFLFVTKYAFASSPMEAITQIAAGKGADTQHEIEQQYLRLQASGLFRGHAVYEVKVKPI